MFSGLEYHNTSFFDAEIIIILKAFGALRLPKQTQKKRDEISCKYNAKIALFVNFGL